MTMTMTTGLGLARVSRAAALLGAAGLLFLSACASSQPAGDPDVAAAPPPATEPEMSAEEARTVVAEIEANWPLAEDNPLLTPASFDDVVKILKRDQVRLFPAAVTFLDGKQEVEAIALHGQIELAWGEAYIILVEVMASLDRLYGGTIRALEEKQKGDGLSEAEGARLSELQAASEKLRRAGRAFTALIVEHLTAGSEKAESAIAKAPDNYLGYRVLADYHRLMEDWSAFEDTVAQISERNPDSNGLRFLKGAAAFKTTRDRSAAATFYREALATDPEFVRAQAHLLMVQTEPAGLHDEYQKLKALNPEHQVIAWAGAGIEKAYANWQAAQGAPES